MPDGNPEHGRLAHLPITLYGSVMGLCGLAIAYLRAGTILLWPMLIGQLLIYFAFVWFLVLSGFYAAKLVRYPRAVRAEFDHPIKMNFFPAFSISLLLFSIGFLHLHPGLARVLWWTGASLHLLATLKILHVWVTRDMHVHSINPAWFIPVVGNILAPIAGVSLAHTEIAWFFFGVGLFYWIALFAIVFNRIVFHDPLPEKLIPTLAIMLAPPAVGFIASHKLTGHLGDFERILFYIAFFMLLFVLSHANRFRKSPYYVSWWAYTFPLAAATIAILLYYHLTDLTAFRFLGAIMLGLTSVVVAYVLVHTVAAALRGEICRAED